MPAAPVHEDHCSHQPYQTTSDHPQPSHSSLPRWHPAECSNQPQWLKPTAYQFVACPQEREAGPPHRTQPIDWCGASLARSPSLPSAPADTRCRRRTRAVPSPQPCRRRTAQPRAARGLQPECSAADVRYSLSGTPAPPSTRPTPRVDDAPTLRIAPRASTGRGPWRRVHGLKFTASGSSHRSGDGLPVLTAGGRPQVRACRGHRCRPADQGCDLEICAAVGHVNVDRR